MLPVNNSIYISTASVYHIVGVIGLTLLHQKHGNRVVVLSKDKILDQEDGVTGSTSFAHN